MAETPSPQSPTQSPSAAASNPSSDHIQYWCYQCEKRVAVETQADHHEIVCYECKNGFVESITVTAPSSRASSLIDENPSFGNEFLQVLRMITLAAREDNAPLPPASENLVDHPDQQPADSIDGNNSDYLRIELDGWDEEGDEDEDEDDENEDEADEVDGERNEEEGEEEAEDGEEPSDDEEEEEENENDVRRRQRAALQLRLRDIATRAVSRRNRILDWAEILMGLEDHSIEFRLQVPDHMDGYIGNPGDYVDAAGYEALLQNLAESDNGGKRGAPPAAKAAVEALKLFEVKLEEDVIVCAICKDLVNVGEFAKMLPCDHGYHGDCIVPWLGSRNTCPLCRHELPTDDPEYEEDRKKRTVSSGGVAASGEGGGSTSSGGSID